MLHFGVLENTPRVLPLLREIPHVLCMDAHISREGLDALLVIHPTDNLPVAGSWLLPGELDIHPVNAAQVITYGLNPRDTITISSALDGNIVVVLQREIMTLMGTRVERQELVCPETMGRDATLALCGALLLCGVPVAEIPAFWNTVKTT